MKKVILIFSCILLLFAGCSNSEKNSGKDVFATNYVGEGQLTVLRSLINSNALFVEEIFVEDFLDAETDKAITDKSGTFAPVESGIFNTYEELKQSVYETYTEEAAKNILAEFDMYRDIYGKLYINTKAKKINARDYDWSNPEIKVNSAADGTYNMEITIKTEKGKDYVFEAKAITVDGNIRLENIYY